MLFVRAYPRETQEMVFDAHDRAFAFFKGTCTRGIYDNMKTAVDTIFVGRERAYNRRFQQMCSVITHPPVAIRRLLRCGSTKVPLDAVTEARIHRIRASRNSARSLQG
jgi:transposase